MREFDSELVKTIQNQSLSTVICSQLEEMILSGAILPGERINESQLSNLLGVSRAPIREACRQLERSGMVEVRAKKGTFVKQIDIREIEELYDIRSALDSMATEKAAQHITKYQIDELQGHLEVMTNATLHNDSQSYFSANLDFHKCILQIAGNQNLIDIYDGVSKKSSLFRRTSLSIPGRLPISLKQHEAIFQAIVQGDSTLAAHLMKQHVMDAKTALLASCAISDET